MAEIVEIASLTIKTDKAIEANAKLKAQIDALKKSQKELDVTTEEGAQQFVRNEATLKNLSKAYGDNKALISALDSATSNLSKTMAIEGKSTQELYDSRRQLNVIAKSVVGDSEKEIALREELNKTIDAQTEALRGQQSGYNSSKDKIGEYTEGINLANISLGGLITQSAEAGGATEVLSSGVKGATSSIKSFTVAALKFIATPIGIVLAAIAAGFIIIQTAMSRSEDASNKLSQAMSSLSAIFSVVLDVVGGLATFLIDVVLVSVNAVADGILWVLDLFGLMSEDSKEIVQATKDLAAAEAELQKMQRNARATQLQYQADAEKLRQIRDDEAKSIEERIKANDELGATLQKQLEAELTIANKRLEVAQLRAKADGESTENLDAIAEAETEIIDINERIISQQSEQLTNYRSLQKEAATLRAEALASEIAILEQQRKATDRSASDRIRTLQEVGAKSKQLLDQQLADNLLTEEAYQLQVLQLSNDTADAVKSEREKSYSDMMEARQADIDSQREELEEFEAMQTAKALTLSEQYDQYKELSERRLAILKDEHAKGLISDRQYNIQRLEEEKELAKQGAELIVDNAAKELAAYVDANSSKLDSDRFFSEQSLQIERDRLEGIKQQQLEFEALRLQQGIISTQQYNDAVNAINEENRLKNEELRVEREEAEKERKAIDLENEIATLTAQGVAEYELRRSELDRMQAAEIANAEKSGADISKIEAKYTAIRKSLDAEINEAKLEGYSNALGSFKELVGEQTVAGKAAAIAETTITTYQAATAAYAAAMQLGAPGLVLAPISAGLAIASGLANVASIVSTPTTFSRGGVLKGASHSQGGIPFTVAGVGGFEAEGGEAIINKRSTAKHYALLSAINEDGGGIRFANGGVVGEISTSQSQGIDYTLMASVLQKALSTAPPPIVSVQQVRDELQTIQQVEVVGKLGS